MTTCGGILASSHPRVFVLAQISNASQRGKGSRPEGGFMGLAVPPHGRYSGGRWHWAGSILRQSWRRSRPCSAAEVKRSLVAFFRLHGSSAAVEMCLKSNRGAVGLSMPSQNRERLLRARCSLRNIVSTRLASRAKALPGNMVGRSFRSEQNCHEEAPFKGVFY